jgi:threonine synthase
LVLNPKVCVYLKTAHLTKFLSIDKDIIKQKQILPKQIQSVIGKNKGVTKIKTYNDLKGYLLE